MEATDKEISLLDKLRKIAIPYGEIVLRMTYQDGQIVRIIIEDKKESIKI